MLKGSMMSWVNHTWNSGMDRFAHDLLLCRQYEKEALWVFCTDQDSKEKGVVVWKGVTSIDFCFLWCATIFSLQRVMVMLQWGTLLFMA